MSVPSDVRALVGSVIATLRTDASVFVDALALDGPIDRAMAGWALDAACEMATPATIDARSLERRYAGERVAVLLGDTVPVAPLRAVLLPFLWGATAVRIRPPRRAPRFTRALLNAMRECAPALDAALHDESGPDFVAGLAGHRVDRLVAFGADDTLAALASSTPVGVTLEAHGHGFGIAVLSSRALEDPRTADALARDIAAFEQRGCLSPQCVFVHEEDALPAARALDAALARAGRTWPQAAPSPHEAVAARTWLGAVGAAARDVLRGEAHAVAVLDQTRFAASPGRRHMAVAPFVETSSIARVLAPFATQLTVVVSDRDAPDLALGPHARRVAPGLAQTPPLDGWEDRRPPRVTRR